MNMIKSIEVMDEVPLYQAPTVTTYTAGELLDLIGPVLAGGVSDGCDSVLDPNCSAGYYAPEDNSGERWA